MTLRNNLLLPEVRRLPVLDDLLVAHGKLVAHVEARAQQRLVVKPPEHEVVGQSEFRWLQNGDERAAVT